MAVNNYFKVKLLRVYVIFLNAPVMQSTMRLLIFLCLFLLSGQHHAYSQTKRVAVIGSSTTVGVGATSTDSCWVSLLKRYYKCQLGIVDSVYNLGVPGTTNYNGMPTGYIPPPSRPYPDTFHNVSRARLILSDLADPADGVVIVNFPTNNYNVYSIAEIMISLQDIYDSAISGGNRCFITTSQPRQDNIFNTSAMKKKLADIKDSIISRFGTEHTLNFWDGMFNPADTTTLPEYACGDQIHFNNAGYRILFERVVAKNIFGMPVWYSKATGYLDELSTWGCNPDGSGSTPQSFATDNQVFNVVNNPSPTISSNWALNGKNIKLIIGDGAMPVDLVIPEGLTISISSPPMGSCY